MVLVVKNLGDSDKPSIMILIFKEMFLSFRETFLYNKQKQHMSMSLNMSMSMSLSLMSRKWLFYKKLRKMTAYMRNMSKKPLGK